ncbi:MAG TPA: DUF2283 domain-containing protein [Candidatus Methanoperedens sp.]
MPQESKEKNKKDIKIWFDKESDYLEVLFEVKEGYFKDTKNDAVMIKVDAEGNIIGFSVSKVSAVDHPLYVNLTDKNIKVNSLSFEEQEILEESMRRNDTLLKKLAKM